MNNEPNAVPQMTRYEGAKDESIKDNSGTIARGGDATIHDRTGLYISIFALALSALALGLWLAQFAYQSQLVEAKVQAGVAKAEAMAHASDTNSRIAIDNVQQLQVQLAAKGIKVTIN